MRMKFGAAVSSANPQLILFQLSACSVNFPLYHRIFSRQYDLSFNGTEADLKRISSILAMYKWIIDVRDCFGRRIFNFRLHNDWSLSYATFKSLLLAIRVIVHRKFYFHQKIHIDTDLKACMPCPCKLSAFSIDYCWVQILGRYYLIFVLWLNVNYYNIC